MSTWKQIKSAAILVFLIVISFSANAAYTINGRVVKVADGDTVTILDANNTQHKIRLLGIDAPESKQAFGQRSKQKMSDLVFGKMVNAECVNTDRYGRNLCKVLVNGIDANFELVKAGLAWHYKQYQSSQTARDRRAYSQAELDARHGKIGLWSDPHAIAPWDFRRKK